MISESEKQVIKDEIKDNDIVMDVGFYTGDWSKEVFNNHDCTIYGFEALKGLTFPSSFLNKHFTLFDDVVISYRNGSVPFNVYLDNPQFSSMYERIGEEKPNILMKQCLTLDYICRKHEINKIDFLKIDVCGAEHNVLEGCGELLQRNRIGKIQIGNYLYKR